MNRRAKYLPLLPLALAYAALLAMGLLVPGMWQLVAMLAFYAALGQAFNIFMGLTGYVDFGYVAFVGVGAYGMALALVHLSSATGLGGAAVFAVGLLLAVLLGGLLAGAVGLVALRLRGAYFAIATVGVNESLRYLIEGTRLWGGSEGMLYYGRMVDLFGRSSINRLTTFWVDVVVLAIAFAAAATTLWMMRSKIGYALTALREDEEAAKILGINVTRYKITAFLISAAFAGLLGAVVWGFKSTYVYPADVFKIEYTMEAIIIVMLGGAGTVQGPLAGGVIYGILKYVLAVYLVAVKFTLFGIVISLQGMQLLIFAPLLIAIVVFFPQGVIGVLKQRVRGTRLEAWVM